MIRKGANPKPTLSEQQRDAEAQRDRAYHARKLALADWFIAAIRNDLPAMKAAADEMERS